MKSKLLLITAAILFLSITSSANALTPTPSTSTSNITPANQAVNEKLNSQINQLKDKIASRVSELNLVEKKGIIGTVTDTSTNMVTLTDADSNKQQVDIDEITKFSSSTVKGSFGLSDLTKGTKVSVVGLYNKQSKRILARFISTSVDPTFLSGVILDIDSKNLTFTLISEDQKKTKIDVETTSKISSYDKAGTATKILFARVATGDRVVVVGYPDKKDPSMIVSDRIAVITDAPKDPKISLPPPTPTDTPAPTLAPAPRTRRAVTPIIKK